MRKELSAAAHALMLRKTLAAALEARRQTCLQALAGLLPQEPALWSRRHPHWGLTPASPSSGHTPTLIPHSQVHHPAAAGHEVRPVCIHNKLKVSECALLQCAACTWRTKVLLEGRWRPQERGRCPEAAAAPYSAAHSACTKSGAASGGRRSNNNSRG